MKGEEMIPVCCPGCGFTCEVEDKYTGLTGTCNKCGFSVIVKPENKQNGFTFQDSPQSSSTRKAFDDKYPPSSQLKNSEIKRKSITSPLTSITPRPWYSLFITDIGKGLFCILIVVVGPIMTMCDVSYISNIINSPKTPIDVRSFYTFECLSFILISAMGIVAGIYILSDDAKWKSKAKAFLLLWFIGPFVIGLIECVFLYNNINPKVSADTLAVYIGGMIPKTIFFGLWWWYISSYKDNPVIPVTKVQPSRNI